MRRLVPALAASAALALAGVGAIAAQANAAPTANPEFNVGNGPLYIDQGNNDDFLFSDPNSKQGDTYVFHFSKAALKGVTAKGSTAGNCKDTNATTVTCTNDLGGTFNTSRNYTVATNAPQDSMSVSVSKNGSLVKVGGSVLYGTIKTGKVADLRFDLQHLVFPNADGTLPNGGITFTFSNYISPYDGQAVPLQFKVTEGKYFALTGKPKGLNCSSTSTTLTCTLQSVAPGADSKVTIPMRFTSGPFHAFKFSIAPVGAWDTTPENNVPVTESKYTSQGVPQGSIVFDQPIASTPTPTPTSTSTTSTTPTVAPTTATTTSDPTSSVSLPTNVPAGVAGPTDSNGGSSMGGPIALGAGILGLLMVGAAALRRRGSHQA